MQRLRQAAGRDGYMHYMVAGEYRSQARGVQRRHDGYFFHPRAEETGAFFGPIKYFLTEGEKSDAAVCFAPGPQGVQSVVAPLSPKDEGSSAGATAVA